MRCYGAFNRHHTLYPPAAHISNGPIYLNSLMENCHHQSENISVLASCKNVSIGGDAGRPATASRHKCGEDAAAVRERLSIHLLSPDLDSYLPCRIAPGSRTCHGDAVRCCCHSDDDDEFEFDVLCSCTSFVLGHKIFLLCSSSRLANVTYITSYYHPRNIPKIESNEIKNKRKGIVYSILTGWLLLLGHGLYSI